MSGIEADGRAMAAELRERARSHNPDGRPAPDDAELPPEIFARLLDGKITASEAHREAQAGAEGRLAFNDLLRREAASNSSRAAAGRFFSGLTGENVPPRDEGGRFTERES